MVVRRDELYCRSSSLLGATTALVLAGLVREELEHSFLSAAARSRRARAGQAERARTDRSSRDWGTLCGRFSCATRQGYVTSSVQVIDGVLSSW